MRLKIITKAVVAAHAATTANCNLTMTMTMKMITMLHAKNQPIPSIETFLH